MKDAAEKELVKQTMIEQDAVFRNQVHELHRLYMIQRNLVDEAKGKNVNEEDMNVNEEDMNVSDNTSENAGKRKLTGFLLPNSPYGEGSSTQACNGSLQNGVGELKVGRRMIDLQLPADEYLDTHETSDTGEKTICPPFQQSKSGRGDASHPNNPSGSCLDVKYLNGLADLNEPLKCQDSEPIALSRDMYSHHGRNNAGVQGQGLEKNQSQNGLMVLEAGHDRSTQRNQLHMPSYSGQVLSNNAFQPQSYPTTDHSKVKFSGERTYRDLEVRSRTPQVSYDSYVESSVASNAPRLHNDYRPDFVRPWSHWSSSWENPMSSSHQKSYPGQTSSFMNFNTHARADSSFETRSRAFNGLYQGFSSGSKQSFFNFPSTAFTPNASLGEVVKSQNFESLQGPKKQECSAGLPWLKPQPTYKSEISNGCFYLNASTNQLMDGPETGADLTTVFPQKGLRSASYSNNAKMGRVEMIKSQSGTKNLGGPILEKQFINKEVNHLVKRDLNINLPCDASVSVDEQGDKAICSDKEGGNKASKFRHYIDLNLSASEDDAETNLRSSLRAKTKARTWIDLEAPPTLESEGEGKSSQEKTKEEIWELMQSQDGNSMNELIKVAAEALVDISLSDHQRHPDDAGSSSTDAAVKSLLSWFADVITSYCDELERKIDGSPEAPEFEGEIDYFEAMTLKLQQMKEEDYMPEPLVPENLKFEGTGIIPARRGQAKRGRPKREFQRDILPRIRSLPRHEVTEDIQTFGGLMQTRDYTWSSGLGARRNPKRKRVSTNISQAPVCPSMAHPMNESVSVVGRETRRPRRQRCPSAGNPATVILT